MKRSTFARSLGAMLAWFGAQPAAAQVQELSGQWMIGPLPGDDPAAGTVHLALFRRQEMSLLGFSVPVSRLHGLAPDQLESPGTPVRFELRGDAGVLELEGGVQAQARASGRYTFSPAAGFVTELVRRGGARPNEFQLLTLVRDDVGLAFVRELGEQGYTLGTADDVARAGRQGGLEYLRALGAAGYRAGSTRSLAQLREAGVAAGWVRELAALGYGRVPAADLVRLRRCGVTPDFVRRANAGAGNRLSVDELVRLHRREQAAVPARGCPAAS